MSLEPTNSDTWEYDQQHPDTNTLKGDKDFKPPEAELPVSEQRRLSQTHHKNEKPTHMVSLTPDEAHQKPEEVLQRRRSSVSSQRAVRRPSRKATGSYGDDTLKPLASISSEEKEQILNSSSNPLFFSEGLAKTN